MENILIWFFLLITTFIATLVVGKVNKAKSWDLFIASLVGVITRVGQFLILGLFFKLVPGLGIPRILFGFVITGLLVFFFLLTPLIANGENKSMRRWWLSYGLFFYLGYFTIGFLQTYLWGIFF